MTIDDLENAVAKPTPDQLAELSIWFKAFDAARLDEAIECDAKHDRLAHRIVDDLRQGRIRKL